MGKRVWVRVVFWVAVLAAATVYYSPTLRRKVLVALLRDQPGTPTGWEPKVRYWNGGVEIRERDELDDIAFRGIAPREFDNITHDG